MVEPRPAPLINETLPAFKSLSLTYYKRYLVKSRALGPASSCVSRLCGSGFSIGMIKRMGDLTGTFGGISLPTHHAVLMHQLPLPGSRLFHDYIYYHCEM
jgi:hypothetical protein